MFTDQSLLYTLPFLMSQKRIQEVYLSKNEFSDISISAFSEIISQLTGLRYISVSESRIDKIETLEFLFRQISLLKNFHSLNLSNISLSDE